MIYSVDVQEAQAVSLANRARAVGSQETEALALAIARSCAAERSGRGFGTGVLIGTLWVAISLAVTCAAYGPGEVWRSFEFVGARLYGF